MDVHELFDQGLEPGVVEVELELQGAERYAPLLLQVGLRSPDGIEKAHPKHRLPLLTASVTPWGLKVNAAESCGSPFIRLYAALRLAPSSRPDGRRSSRARRTIFLQPDTEVDAVGPHIDVVAVREIALLEGLAAPPALRPSGR